MPPVPGHRTTIEKFIADNEVAIFSKSTCPFCVKVKALFDQLNVKYTALELNEIENGADIHEDLKALSGQNSVPNVYINGTHIGGNDTVQSLHKNKELLKLLKNMSFDYELIVIGGGSGGLAAAKAAADLGHKVCVCDYVQPSPQGTTWGLGGTCVNVGCIPKKLMHTAAILKHALHDSIRYGFETPEVTHNWKTMVDNIQDHIGGLNWNHKVDLREKDATYLNSYATFIDPHTIKTVNKKGKEQIITGEKFLIATGGRPRYPDIPGAKEYAITSDDIFSLPYSPGKTLCVGASYISLETAGFLQGLGYDVTVMVRSILLRGFDQQMAGLIGDHMEEQGVKFVRECVPTAIECIEEGSPGRYKVTGKCNSGDEYVEEFNTILFAIGRDPITTQIGLPDIGVQLNEKSGKVIVNEADQSSVENIYCIGDIREGGLELTPVAIQAGRLLVKRLYGDSEVLTDYINVPTTVFTPLEYGSCGYSEEQAKEKFGEEDIEVYHSFYWPLEQKLAKRDENKCYAKLICVKSEKERVVGFHVVGPNAGEITQGFGLGLKLGATKADFDNLIGIHPTSAEIFTTLSVSKSSGGDVEVAGC